MEFTFDNERPIYVQIVEQLKMFIISGKLEPGNRMPSVRELALMTKVNPNTMQKALMELEDLKLIYTERTNGKYVTTDRNLIEKYRQINAQKNVERYLNDMQSLGFTEKEAIDILGGKNR